MNGAGRDINIRRGRMGGASAYVIVQADRLEENAGDVTVAGNVTVRRI